MWHILVAGSDLPGISSDHGGPGLCPCGAGLLVGHGEQFMVDH